MADQSRGARMLPRSIPEPLLPAVEKLLKYYQEERWGKATFEMKRGVPVGKVRTEFSEELPDPT